jgi:hypothetical protein
MTCLHPNHPPETALGRPAGQSRTGGMTETLHRAGGAGCHAGSYRLQFFIALCVSAKRPLLPARYVYEGFPIRDILDAQVGKWYYATESCCGL